MRLTISVLGPDGSAKASAQGVDAVNLVYAASYEQGDIICLTGDQSGHVVAMLEDSLGQVLGYLSGQFRLVVPFDEKRVSYSPKSFFGNIHLLQARVAEKKEIGAYRNLAFNPLDSHENSGLYPHASANVETRGESVFAARNAIDGCYANVCHGPWPYQSWGINRDPEAELTLDFGREVTIDRLVFTLRADFPHDNWWKRCTVRFSDGSQLTPAFVKTGARQPVDIVPRTVRWLKVGQLIKDDGPSPFPALTQIEAWGSDGNII